MKYVVVALLPNLLRMDNAMPFVYAEFGRYPCERNRKRTRNSVTEHDGRPLSDHDAVCYLRRNDNNDIWW